MKKLSNKIQDRPAGPSTAIFELIAISLCGGVVGLFIWLMEATK